MVPGLRTSSSLSRESAEPTGAIAMCTKRFSLIDSSSRSRTGHRGLFYDNQSATQSTTHSSCDIPLSPSWVSTTYTHEDIYSSWQTPQRRKGEGTVLEGRKRILQCTTVSAVTREEGTAAREEDWREEKRLGGHALDLRGGRYCAFVTATN
ncbi:hypothetical protein BDZ45DRAFT_753205 [Acephala macrosclerotiorum]|nr:hypothetical protein BDZ45DRAFT_753205 [Acephala macrosclerotiorum]